MIHLKLDINNGIDQEKTKVGVNAFQEKNDLVVDVVVGIRTGVSFIPQKPSPICGGELAIVWQIFKIVKTSKNTYIIVFLEVLLKYLHRLNILNNKAFSSLESSYCLSERFKYT